MNNSQNQMKLINSLMLFIREFFCAQEFYFINAQEKHFRNKQVITAF